MQANSWQRLSQYLKMLKLQKLEREVPLSPQERLQSCSSSQDQKVCSHLFFMADRLLYNLELFSTLGINILNATENK